MSNKSRKVFATTAAAAMAVSAIVPAATLAAEETQQVFPDVPADHNYAQVIKDLKDAEVVNGYEDGEFKMGETITRAEAAQMVANIRGLDTDNAPEAPFEDVKQGVWYSGAINALFEAGHITGRTETTFAPNDNITRAELTQLVYAAYGIEAAPNAELPFEDLAAGEDVWYKEPLKALYSNELISGRTATTFEPNADMLRGDFAWLLANTDYKFGDTLTAPAPEVDEIEVATEEAIKAVEAFEAVEINSYADVVVANKLLAEAQEAIANLEALSEDSVQVLGVDTDLIEELNSRVESKVEAIEEVKTEKAEAVKNANNEVEKFESLNAFFTNVDSSLISEYTTEIEEATTAEEIQTAINKVNKEVAINNAVDAVNKASNQVELLEALQAGAEVEAFTNVRADYIATYAEGILGENDLNQEEIQAVLDEATNKIVRAAETTVAQAEDTPSDENLEAAKKEVANVPADLVDDEGNNILEGFQERLANVAIVTDVLNANKVSHIRLLDSLNNNEFTNVNEELISVYSEGIKGIQGKITVEKIQYTIDFINAEDATSELTTTADNELLALAEGVGQEEISAAKALVELLPNLGELNEETGEKAVHAEKQQLLDKVEEAQAFIDALNIKDQEGLQSALDNENIVELKLVDSFETTEQFVVSRSLTIDGGNNTITFTGDKEDWQGNYVVQVYNTTDVTISNIKITGGDAALLINGSNVVLEGTVDVSGNEFGGIESSKGENLTEGKLDVNEATLVNTTEAYGQPTIWEDKVEDTVKSKEGTFTTNDSIKANQVQYYLIENNTVNPLPKQIEAAEKAVNALTKDGELVADQAAIDAASKLVEALPAEETSKSELQLAVADAQDKFDRAAINNATTATELQPLLVALKSDEYNNLTKVQRLEVANLFLDSLEEGKFDSTEEIKTALIKEVGVPATEDSSATGYHKLLTDVNTADGITAMTVALENLNNAEFDAMTDAEKLVAAENVLNNKPEETVYTSISQIVNNF